VKAIAIPLGLAAALVVIAGTVACSGGDGEAEAGGAASPAATVASEPQAQAAVAEPTATAEPAAEGVKVEVLATNDYSFEPEQIELKAGETVTLVLDSSRSFESHSFVIDEIEGVNVAADAGIVASIAFTPLEPGTYTFYCSVAGHREEGMEGTLTVVE